VEDKEIAKWKQLKRVDGWLWFTCAYFLFTLLSSSKLSSAFTGHAHSAKDIHTLWSNSLHSST